MRQFLLILFCLASAVIASVALAQAPDGDALGKQYLPVFPLTCLEVQGLGESTLGNEVRALCEQAGVEVQADNEPEHNRFIRSDQYRFISKGVAEFGYIPGTPEEKIFKAWYAERDHAPSDDANQPVDLAATAQGKAILEKLTLRVAEASQRPKRKPESFFRRFAR